jgi:hypothetical protein
MDVVGRRAVKKKSCKKVDRFDFYSFTSIGHILGAYIIVQLVVKNDGAS